MTEIDDIIIRNAEVNEFEEVGKLMVDVYSQLEGFPKASEQPDYYRMLLNVGELTKNNGTKIIAAVDRKNKLLGAVVFFSDMQYYGSGGIATKEKGATGFRLLAVKNEARGKGIGKLLTLECIERTRNINIKQVIIHTTKAMMTAWKMYENMGFKRSTDLDFMQSELSVYGFRLIL